MTGLRELLDAYVGDGTVPGAVGLVARGDGVEVAAVGALDAGGGAPMTRDTIFRLASVTKPVIAAAAMMLVDDGRIALEDPVAPWLPELDSPVVVRTPDAPPTDVVPAERAITVLDLLTFRAGYGFPADFSLPAVKPLFSELKQGPSLPHEVPDPDAWMAALARIPLLYQPGAAWLYNTCSDILGVLIARVSGRTLPDFLAERLFEPLGMRDTGFAVPSAALGRFASYYRGPQGGGEGLELVDTPDGQWSSLPGFPSGAGGLVSTVDDWHAFARMLLAEGRAGGEAGGGTRGRRLLTPESVRLMTTNHLSLTEREGGGLFLEGMGWGFGGSVDLVAAEAWNVPGRYGWVGGTGTTAHLTPSTGTLAVLLTQREMAGPTPPAIMRDFWRYAAGV